MKIKNIALVLVIIIIIITGCNKVEKMTINSCENCAFSFYDEEASKRYGDGIYLNKFTYNYNDLKIKNGDSRRMFLGHILEGGIIKRGFACGINNKNVFCIEGTRDGSSYEDNVVILKSIFGDINCKEDDYSIICKDEIIAGTNRDGTANVGNLEDGIECMAISNGTMNCS